MAQVFQAPHRQWRSIDGRGSTNHDNHTLMVKNVPGHLSESEVRDILMSNPWDGVWACNSNGRRNPVTSASEPIEGQFFVNFVNADLAKDAQQKWNGQVIGGNQLRVEFKTLRLGQSPTHPSQHDEALWEMRVNEWEKAQSQTVAQVPEVFPAHLSLQRKAPAEFRVCAPEFIPQSHVPIEPSINAGPSTFPSTASSSAVGNSPLGRFTVPPTTLPTQDVKGKRSKAIGYPTTSSNIVAPIPRHARGQNHQTLRKVKTFSTKPSSSNMRSQDLEFTWKQFEYAVLGGDMPHECNEVSALLASLPLLMVD
jgi:RNA recognition motif-containing protein